MIDRQDREDRRDRHAVREKGAAMPMRENIRSLPLLSVAEHIDTTWREDAGARHIHIEALRRRSPREDTEEAPSKAESGSGPLASRDADNDPGSGFLRHLPRWARLRRAPANGNIRDDKSGGEAKPINSISEPPEPSRPDAVATTLLDHQTGHGSAYTDDTAGQYWKPLIDPMKVFGGVGRSKALIVAMALLGAVLGAAIAISTPKKYEATTELIVDPRDLNLTDRSLTDSILASDATLAIVENQMRVLTSGTVLNKVVDELHLNADPEFNGSRPAFSVREFVRSLLPGHDDSAASVEDRRRVIAVRTLGQAVTVQRSGKTFVISITVTTENADKSALIANTMTDVFLQTYGQIQSKKAGRATDELTSRLAELRKGVETTERKVEDFRATHDLVDAKGHLISDDQLLKLNEQLSVARAHTMELNAKAASARSVDVDSVLGGGLPEGINSPTMQDLRLQYATLKQEADRAAIKYGPRHPARQIVDAQLSGAKQRIATELRRIVSSLQTELKRAVQIEQDLASRLAQQKVRNGDINDDLVTLRELEREASAKRTVYEAFLLRAKQTDEQKDINTANVSVISKAFPPLDPEGPSRAMITLAGLLLGLAAGVGLGGLRGAYESLRETADRRSQGNDRPPQRRVDENDITPSPHAIRSDVAFEPGLEPAPTRREPHAKEPADEEMSLEEIRASLREFRQAVREFSENRSGRDYF
ncbi:GumC family protein [Manganibacter manganicus]|uniref:Succinoglycan biosynthesis protein exop n=1 Tax=Manganibacter manganicus TaxID=1873176 RepID=A0A1V8RQJ2_9HYPH|nr:GumC family protein [Pseudaminobacter manganicus]OQM75249.1 hypothetical protein BFN67_18995 [Pseudaminobacter manganicus]